MLSESRAAQGGAAAQQPEKEKVRKREISILGQETSIMLKEFKKHFNLTTGTAPSQLITISDWFKLVMSLR